MHVSVGDIYSRWTVISPARPTYYAGYPHRHWICVCECGSEKRVTELSLKNGKSKSCGCLAKEIWRVVHTRHGMSKTAEYQSWKNMIARTNNPKNKRYKDYGGRGISVCKEWRESFQEFFSNLGLKPTPGHQIDRIDNEGNYEPGNCQWSLPVVQMVNRRNTRTVSTSNGDVPLADLAKQSGIPANTLRARILKGWDLQVALATPVRGKTPNGTGRARDL